MNKQAIRRRGLWSESAGKCVKLIHPCTANRISLPFYVSRVASVFRMCPSSTSRGGGRGKAILAAVKANSAAATKDVTVLVEKEARAAETRIRAEQDERLAEVEETVKAEGQTKMKSLADGLHVVIGEVISKIEG